MTLEEKAKSYCNKTGGWVGKKEAFIDGYNMRDMEIQWVKCSERLP